MPQYFKAIETWHFDIQKDDIRLLFLYAFQSLDTIACFQHLDVVKCQ